MWQFFHPQLRALPRDLRQRVIRRVQWKTLLSWKMWVLWAVAVGAPFGMPARWLDHLSASLSLVIMALPLLVGLPLSMWMQERIIERCVREGTPHTCPHCGYDLTANVSGTCPECGTPIPPHDPGLSDKFS